jgi:hypothetical protein
MPVVAFLADGVDGNSPWQKQLAVSPADVATLASHPITALLLHNVEAGIPLHWSQIKHRHFPAAFRQQAASDLQAAMPVLVTLPGSARHLVVERLMHSKAVAEHWSFLPDTVWQGKWEECLTAEEWVAVQQVPSIAPKPAEPALPPNAQMAEYQFQVRAAAGPHRHNRVWSWRAVAKRLVFGALTGALAGAAGGQDGKLQALDALAGFMLGCAQPVWALPLSVLAMMATLERNQRNAHRSGAKKLLGKLKLPRIRFDHSDLLMRTQLEW